MRLLDVRWISASSRSAGVKPAYPPPRVSSDRFSGSKGILSRLTQYGKLQGHTGSINTISFNPTGDLLVSGSDDTDIILWDWLAKTKRLVYPSGHQESIFHARVIPFTDDSTIVTLSADGQVRVGQLKGGGEVSTKQIGAHDGRAHKLALAPGAPRIFYSCGEDGLVQHFDLRSESAMKLFTCYSFSESDHRVRLYSIAIDPRRPNYFAVGGSDQYVRVYDTRRTQLDASSNMDQPVDTFCPKHLHDWTNPMYGKAYVSGVAYSGSREILASYNDELVYLFQNDMGLGTNPESAEPDELDDDPQEYTGHRNFKTIKGVSFFGPNDEYVLSGSDCGHLFLWRKKGGELMRIMHADQNVVNCVEPHPHLPFLATSGIDINVKIWAPSSDKAVLLPRNADKITGHNKLNREVSSHRQEVLITPEQIMDALRASRREAELYEAHETSASRRDDANRNQQASNSDPGGCTVS